MFLRLEERQQRGQDRILCVLHLTIFLMAHLPRPCSWTSHGFGIVGVSRPGHASPCVRVARSWREQLTKQKSRRQHHRPEPTAVPLPWHPLRLPLSTQALLSIVLLQGHPVWRACPRPWPPASPLKPALLSSQRSVPVTPRPSHWHGAPRELMSQHLLKPQSPLFMIY